MIKIEKTYIYNADGAMLHDLAWSPDSNYLAACGGLSKLGPERERIILKAEVIVWEALTGKTVSRYRHHQDVPIHLSWSPDGSRIASGGWDRTVHLWEAMTGHHLRTYTGHSTSVTAIDWSPDGTRLLSAESNHTYQSKEKHVEQHIWDEQSLATLITYTGHTDSVYCARWSPDGIKIVSGSHDHTAQVWHARTGRHVVTYGQHTDSIYDVAWAPDGSVIASASQDHSVQVWESLSGQMRYSHLSPRQRPMMNVAWSPDGHYLAVISSTGELLDGATGKTIRTFGPVNAGMQHIMWSPKGNYLAWLQETKVQVCWVHDE